MRRVSQRGGITYTELAALDIREFFVNLTMYEDEVKKEVAAHKKQLEQMKPKKKKK